MVRKWLREHGSVIVVFILIMLGVVFLFLGNLLSDSTKSLPKLFCILLVQLGGTLIVAAVATIIFSFRDIQESIGKVASQLLANAEVIPLLSGEAKDRLEERTVLDRLGSTVSSLHPVLYKDITIFRDQCLSTFHLQNFTQGTTIFPYPSNPAFVYRESTRSFKVVRQHLAEDHKTFSLCYCLSIKIPENISISNEDFITSFEVKADDDRFGINDAEFVRRNKGSQREIQLIFNQPIEVKKSLNVQITSRCLASAVDNVDIFRVRYPTEGFTVVFRYLKSLQYFASWFKSPKEIKSDAGADFKIDDFEYLVDGIMASTHDWVLPGEGIAISWHPSKPVAIESASTVESKKKSQ